MKKLKTATLTILLIISVLKTAAQESGSGTYRQLSDFPFVFVSDESIVTPPTITDSLFDAASRGIRFKVNRTDIQSNDPFIPLYREKLVPWLKSEEMQLRQVFVKGAASPEGPYQNNVRLSRERTQRLIDFLNTELGERMTARPVDAKSITEDYGLLVRMMRQANDPSYDQVNRIWLSCNGDEACCKRELMALENGKVWKRLKETYFPDLRQARVILWFARKPEAKPRYRPITLRPTGPEHYEFSKHYQETSLGTLQPSPVEIPLEYSRRHLIAARTNLVHDLLVVPQFGFAYGGNLQLEYYPLRGHYTYNIGFTYSNHHHWDDHKFFQMRDLQLELRRYFRGGGEFKGTYLGVYAEGTVYGIGFSKTKGWQGEGGGGGLTLGYTCALNRKGNLRLELSASLGLFYTRYDPYVYGNPLTSEEDDLYYYDYKGNSSDFTKRNHQFTWFGPTNAGIHLTYDIIYRKKQLRTASQQKGGKL
ncbi:MAG: DUF3575 domain-containing protein [Prevotella sp.]|nr:DUF3575 domain-containing protein [Prevotella sp.]